MRDFSPDEIKTRIASLQTCMHKNALDVAILTSSKDIYYYSASLQPLYLFVPARGEALILARKGLGRIEEETSGQAIAYFRNTQEFTEAIRAHGLSAAAAVGLAFETLTHQAFLRFQKLLPGTAFKDLSWDLRMLRIVKSEAECALVRIGAEKCARLPEVVRSGFKPGMTELELSCVIEDYFRSQGLGINHSRQEGADFGYGICSSGDNSASPTRFDGIASGKGLSAALPFGASRDAIEMNRPILLDFGVTERGYHVDQTRMAVWGEPDAEADRAYRAMLDIEDALMARHLKPGVSWQEAWNAAERLAAEAGYAESFMGRGTEKVSFVGHGVGLELDEPPYLAPGKDFPLEFGMTIAIEPKVVLARSGVIGIEDTVVITDRGAEYLTTADRDWIKL